MSDTRTTDGPDPLDPESGNTSTRVGPDEYAGILVPDPQPEDLPDDPDVEELLGRLDLRQQVRLLTGADFWALHPEPAVGLRRMVTSDGPAGVRGEAWDERDPSANTPSPTALAATWDPARIERIGRLLAAEARSKGVDVLLAPTINLHRTPFGGRHFECLSEDPLLTAVIATAYVRGVQSQGVAATIKHFVANDSETDRFSVDVTVDERTLRELYLAPFEQVLADAAPWAVMAAYNGVGGRTMTESPLLTEVLKGEWGFDGVVVSDWFATRSTEAAGGAGLDLAMPGPDGPWGDALVAAVEAGRVGEDAVRDKVRRLLRLAERVGALEGTFAPVPEPWPTDRVAGELRSAAAAGFVLAKNDADLLPLRRDALRTVALIGPDSAEGRLMGGGSATVFPAYPVGPLEGLRRVLGEDVEVTHSPGVSSTDRTAPLPPAWLDGGAEVRFLADDGTELHRETRHASSLMYLGRIEGDLTVSDVSQVELTARVRVPHDGRYDVGVAGVGPFVLSVDGETVLDQAVELPEGADPIEGMMRPPMAVRAVELRADAPVELVLRHEPVSADGFGDVDTATMTFKLLLAPVQVPDEALLEQAVAAAAAADVAVVVVGTTAEVESEGFDRVSLALPGGQDDLVRRVVAANPRTVVVVNAGAPVLLPWADEVPAVLLTWFPGQEFGNALSDVLLGTREPGGRLPVTWPSSPDGLPSTQPVDGVLDYAEGLRIGYRRYGGGGSDDHPQPLFGFGHGLGYTTFELGEVAVTGDPASGVQVSVPVTCTGVRSGRQVVQVYASRDGGQVERVPRWLVGFALVDVAPGETVTAVVDVARRSFEHWDVGTGAWQLEPGAFRLHVGTSLATVDAGTDVG
ncbi:beta-glucosidase H [Aquipuribacter sp. MA13-6]|uniref:beta-glucosidase n=1 Tax=unclassified Aquipuribacter TaxID=2635084 RepID=UPI003EE889C7